MTKNTLKEIEETVLSALHQIAPEVDLQMLDRTINFREELEIDSMDFLRFVRLLHEQLSIEIPEADYSQLQTLNNCFNYFDRKINR